ISRCPRVRRTVTPCRKSARPCRKIALVSHPNETHLCVPTRRRSREPVTTHQLWSWRARASAVMLAVTTGACGNAERRAAEARADSLQAALQRERDSLNAAREKATAQATQAVEQRRREDSLKAARRQAAADSIRAEGLRPRELAL